MITKFDLAVIQLEALQETRQILDEFYAMYLGEFAPKGEELGIMPEESEDGESDLSGEEIGYMGDNRPKSVW